ncbi:MAG: NERD domain-containing protein [Candidatus Microthrix sp.]|nr:NERD domain-containing protein [Candidatus Microthrix sp.]
MEAAPGGSPPRTNFEFTNGGAIAEVDSLVITPKGVYLIEIKSWAGEVNGDQGMGHSAPTAAVGRHQPGCGHSARSQLASHSALAPTGPPFIQSLVWFSLAELR